LQLLHELRAIIQKSVKRIIESLKKVKHYSTLSIT